MDAPASTGALSCAALLMTVASLEDAQRLLTVVEECHDTRGIDLHHAVRGRATR